ncbi:MAG TPA: FIST N-terminal domain-containing protein [Acidimicrobiales bacterium]|nr:FIST N-terminal domain-containing protein [Acidimicrobiales bacterium]
MEPRAATRRRTTATGRRWLGVGHRRGDGARRAAAGAVGDALAGDDAQLLVVFCSDAYDLDDLLAGAADAAPGVALIGCSTAGEISGTGPGDAGVVVMALGGPGFGVATAAARADGGRLRQASAAVARCVEEVADRPHRVLLLLTDGLAGDQQEVVRGAYRTVGAEVPLVGGCAGDGLRMTRTFQLHGTRVLGGSVVGAAIGSDAPIGIGVRHGWRRVGEAMVVTASAGNRVLRIDDAPALDVYLDRLGAPAEARTEPAAFTRFAITHPLGLSRRSGEEVRFVAGADFADRSLVCIAQVPQGGQAWIMEGDDESVLAATDQACGEAVGALGGRRPLGLLAFDCIARRGVLGDAGIAREISRISDFAGGAPVAGFYTYGEIARTTGISGFHNQTLVVLALA